MKTIISVLIIICAANVFAQRNCDLDSSGLIPINDLGISQFRGYTGGLYPDGSNQRSGTHFDETIAQSKLITPLSPGGMPDANGKIVMIGVGASNPRTEFNAFMERVDTFSAKRSSLFVVNTCIGGQGIQKMNNTADNYWKQAAHTLDSLGLTPEQVQIAWIETDNTQTADTAFPSAPLALMNDYLTLLKTLHTLYPNLKICYLTARAYSGYVDPTGADVGKGLLFPRDYYNGWTIKWLIENQITKQSGYSYSGASAEIPFITWGSNLWADGKNKRSDGLYWDCMTDIGPDGLHLTSIGEQKSGAMIFSDFLKDTTATYWLREKQTPLAVEENSANNLLAAYPNPASNELKIDFSSAESENATVTLYDLQGRMIREAEGSNNSEVKWDVSSITEGSYILKLTTTKESNSRLITIIH